MTKRKADSIALLSLYVNYIQQEEEEDDDDANGDDCREQNGAEKEEEEEEEDIIKHFDDDRETGKIVQFPFATSADFAMASVIRPATPACHNILGLGIADYAPEDVDMSPEAKGQEEADVGRVIFEGGDVLVAVLEKVAHAPSSQEEKEKPPEKTGAGIFDEEFRIGKASPFGKDISCNEIAEQAANALGPTEDLFGGFLPFPPAKKCSDELQMRITKYLQIKSQGRNFNKELRGLKDYRNPDFLQRVVKHLGIDELGSLFGKDIFDAHSLDGSDFYDALLAQQRHGKFRR
ncbi:hypothetical protein O6H91_23G025400 [Diphasiastrum complanatum]|uniref:Uncharacterized protein n=1 Tax=Diphasiastrum complanatum TaxID=34168 RepID=A0ACC2A980_DIPCM|nr:hypothetical protein O6H91_23G025400 [Diphasiastrum complanatum]